MKWFAVIVSLMAVGVIGFCAGMALRTIERPEPDTIAPKVAPTLPSNEPREEALLQHVQGLFDAPRTYRNRLEVRIALLQMDADQLKALWNHYHSRKGDESRRILSRLAEMDPAAALEKASESGVHRYMLLPDVLSGWAKTDLASALAWIENANNPRIKHRCMAAVIDQIGTTDPQKALDLYYQAIDDKMLPRGDVFFEIESFFGRWARRAPDVAMAMALELKRRLNNNRGILGAINAWSKTDGEAAAHWIETNASVDVRDEAYITLVEGWAEVEPRKAADFIMTLKKKETEITSVEFNPWGGTPFVTGLWHVLGDWVELDFDAAATWVDSIEDARLRESVQAALVERSRDYADREPAFEYALRNLDNPKMMEAISGHAWDMVREDPEAAFAWAEENLSEPEHRIAYDTSILKALSKRHPSQAASRLDMLPKGSLEREKLHGTIAHQWAAGDPNEALAWANQLPDGPEYDAAVLGLAEGWLTSDPNAAGDWIASVDPSPMRDQLVSRHARETMREKQIERSINLAREIEDPFLRDQTFEGILKNWYRDQIKAEAARAFIESSTDISDTVRWRILNRPWGHP